jgi:hypothetical protein
VLDYHIFQIIGWYLHWPKFLQIIFCYFYNLTLQLIRGVFNWNISNSCWFTVIRVLCVFWGFHSWRSWWTRKWGVRRYHNAWCTDIPGSFFCTYLWNWPVTSHLKCWLNGCQIKGILLYIEVYYACANVCMLKCTMYVSLSGADCNSALCAYKTTGSCEVVLTDAQLQKCRNHSNW